MTDDWILEYGDDGEIYTPPVDANRESIKRYLGLIDRKTGTYYCGIGRSQRDTGLRCFGESDRRIIEGMHDGSSFVVRRSGVVGGTPVRVRHGAVSTESFLADPMEVLTPQEALEVFDYFLVTEKLPAGYLEEPKSYVFG